MASNIYPFLEILPAGIYSLLTLWCGHDFFKGQSLKTDFKSKLAQEGDMSSGQAVLDLFPVSIMKPVKGLDEDSYENFASFCRQDYAAPVQLVFCFAQPDDPAIDVVQKLIKDFPDHDIILNIDPAIHGPNYKVSNLVNGFPKARYDLLIISDSDIRVTPYFLKSVTSHFVDPAVGLVMSPYRSSKVHGTATAFEALAFTGEMIPNVVTAMKLEGLSFALGAAMTFRREALQDIGGLITLADYLADDYQLGNRIKKAGWRLILDHEFVESMLKPEMISDILSRQLRWSRTMRVSRTGGYLVSGITLPGLAVIMALLTGPFNAALAAIFLLYLVRLAVSTVFSRRFVKDNLLPSWGWLLPIRDLIAFATWLLAFTGNSVRWRGFRFNILPDGKLSEP